MARPYQSPAMRQKMGAMASSTPSPMDEGDMGGEVPAAESPTGSDAKPTAFLSKEMGGGKQWKPGDEIVLKVDAVDPESGELQVSYAPEKPSDEPSDTMDAMDKAMPETGEPANPGNY